MCIRDRYKIVGGHRFYDRKEIKDILAYMSIVANKNDDLRLRRIINEPARKIGAATVQDVYKRQVLADDVPYKAGL